MKKAAPSTSSGAAFGLSDRTVCQFLQALVADDSARPFRHTLDVEALVLLHELDMQQVAFREAIQSTIS